MSLCCYEGPEDSPDSYWSGCPGGGLGIPVAYFTKSGRGADQFAVIMAKVRSVIDNVIFPACCFWRRDLSDYYRTVPGGMGEDDCCS